MQAFQRFTGQTSEIYIFLIYRKSFKTEIDEEITEKLPLNSQKTKLLSSLASLHDQLCATVALTNFCFSLAITAYIGSALLMEIFSLFELYASVVAKTKQTQQIGYCLLANLWNCFLFSFVFATVCVCSWSKRAARETSIILHKALHYQNDEKIQRRVRNFELSLKVTN